MPGKFLIDVTDARFFIDWNDGVIRFIRTKNPFAHSDVASVLLDLGKELPGAHAYCPSYGSMAYVVLHTEASRIFAIAFGQRRLAFRIPPPAHADALLDGSVPAPEIGAEWIAFAPWGAHADERLRRWCGRALEAADRYADPPV